MSIDMDGAGTAHRDAAPKLCASESIHIAQHPKERRIRLYVCVVAGTVYFQCVAHGLNSLAKRKSSALSGLLLA